jgi:selenium metabolism protein YedF
METVDACGQVCPKPLILTKKALKKAAPGDQIQILIDNATSRQNVERFLVDNGMQPKCTKEAEVFTISVQKQTEPLTHPDAASYCTTDSSSHVIVFGCDKMGQGADELGEILIKAFVNTIKETAPLPSHLVFYNSGIFLTIEGSHVLDALKELETKGVTILVCGTCADYYDKKEVVRVGVISNMYTILETMTGARHIVQP